VGFGVNEPEVARHAPYPALDNPKQANGLVLDPVFPGKSCTTPLQARNRPSRTLIFVQFLFGFAGIVLKQMSTACAALAAKYDK
jgi:hypothetical protein